MRVLQINSVCGTGSTGRIAVDIAKTLEVQGHDCLIAYGRGQAVNWNNVYKIESNFGNKLHALGTRFFDNHGLQSTKATKELLKVINQYNPDVIHLHNLHGYYLNYKVLFDFLKKFNKKVIWTLHDCWPFTGHCAHFDYVGCDKWKTQCYKCPQKTSYPKSCLIDNSKKNYISKKQSFSGVKDLTIVTPSKWLADLVSVSFLREYKTVVIPNGIDLDIFKPTKSDFKEKMNLQDKKIILGVANIWNKRKGLEDFIKLSKILEDSYQIILVGLNDKQMKILPNNIIGIKRTDSVKELIEIYSAADVFINPTYEDNYPTVNLEALACGTPIITYRTGGSVEAVADGNGIIVDKGDINEMVLAIKKICTEEKQSEQIIDREKNLYVRTKMIDEFQKIYTEFD